VNGLLSRGVCGRAVGLFAWLALATLLVAGSARAQDLVPRTVIALYDGGEGRSYHFTPLHRAAEMPPNHLGLVVVPHDISRGLPSAERMRGVRGIITWFSSAPIADPLAYLTWLDEQMNEGVRVVMIGDVGFSLSSLSALQVRRRFERVMSRIGIEWRGEWVSLTYGARIVAKEPAMVEFERPYPKLLQPYLRVGAAGREAKAYLSVTRQGRGDEDDLVVVGPAGAYVASGYAALFRDEAPFVRAWYVNPFQFFREAFATDDVPKLDTTTLSGRRIYYSHIDGDAWHNVVSLELYRDRRAVAAEVVLEQIIQKYPELPVTVAPISADLEVTWYGNDEARVLARRIFAMRNVEAGSHTHSHPFAWMFFRDPNPKKEAPYLPRYPARPGKSLAESVWDGGASAQSGAPPAEPIDGVYERPRSYAVKPFDIAAEIEGSARIIQYLLPPGRRVAVMQWSGDTTPWAGVLAQTRKAGMRNINGGDPRMDGLYDSYAWVSPVARRVDDEWQIYSSGANENIYTDNWRRRFYAFRYLVESLRNMESPLRIKPINVYYHFYSAEREEGLSSLFHILDYVRTQSVAPIATSRFAAIAQGFLEAKVWRIGERQWRIENRDGLQTVRFDRASTLAVDFARSRGVVGQTHFQGSLYVALDGADEGPVVALMDYANPERAPDAAVPYLVEARWSVERVERQDQAWRFRAQGFGPGQFVWKVPAPGRFVVTADAGEGPTTSTAAVGRDGLLRFTLAIAGEEGVDVSVRPEAAAQ